MSDIAGKTGIKIPSLYSHFESKDEIISQVLEREMTKMYDFFNKTIDRLKNENTELKLKQLFFSVFDYFKTPGQLEILRRIPFIDNEQIKVETDENHSGKGRDFLSKVKKIMEAWDFIRRGTWKCGRRGSCSCIGP